MTAEKKPRMRAIPIKLSPDQIFELDLIATRKTRKSGSLVSRAWCIREAIARYIQQETKPC